MSTLRFVRVNITDPRPYVASCDDLLAGIIPGVTAADFLARLAQAEERIAQAFRRGSRQLVVGQMIRDSPAERLKQQYRAVTQWSGFWRMDGDNEQTTEPDFDFRPFENAGARINLGSVSAFVSKSGSVFNPAFDELDQAVRLLQGPPTAGDFWGVQRALDDFHVFDEGNRKAVEWIDQMRTDVISATDPYFQFRAVRRRKRLESIDSRGSVFIQAAEIAAGIVASLWDRRTLLSVVRTFDHVTYNGKRIGETDAGRITHDLARHKQDRRRLPLLAP